MARLRVRINGSEVGGADAEVIVRRLLCEPHDDVRHGGTQWCEFPSLTDGQIEGYVGLLRSRGMHVRYLQILDAEGLRARLLDQPLAALVAAAEKG